MARRAQIGMMLAAAFGGRRDRSATRWPWGQRAGAGGGDQTPREAHAAGRAGMSPWCVVHGQDLFKFEINL